MADVDATVEVVHLSDFDARLTAPKTPDWLIYERAATARFDGIVTRDYSQTNQPEELWLLTQLRLHVITFRKPIEDPITEWGQLLVYLPIIRKRFADVKPRVIFLPRPNIAADRGVTKPKDLLHQLARDLGISAGQIRQEAERSIEAYREEHPQPSA